MPSLLIFIIIPNSQHNTEKSEGHKKTNPELFQIKSEGNNSENNYDDNLTVHKDSVAANPKYEFITSPANSKDILLSSLIKSDKQPAINDGVINIYPYQSLNHSDRVKTEDLASFRNETPVDKESTDTDAVKRKDRTVKSKRGRPKKDPAAPKKAVKIKAPPPPVTPESSDGETPIDRDDMENLLLDYLIKRKRTQQDARRNMWATLAGLS